MSYETRLDTIVTHAWGTWTKNGLGLDSDDRKETLRSVQDAANNTYIEGISDLDWLNATLKRLRARVKPMTDRQIAVAVPSGASIEQERDGSWTVYRAGDPYATTGGFKSPEDAARAARGEAPTYDGLYSGDWQHQKVSPHDNQPLASA